jgi:hypothetical protein
MALRAYPCRYRLLGVAYLPTFGVGPKSPPLNLTFDGERALGGEPKGLGLGSSRPAATFQQRVDCPERVYR